MNYNILKQIFKEHGYKVTSQRQVVIDILTDNCDKHMSCDDVYKSARETYPNLGIATIYRTMQLLADIGIVSRIKIENLNRYELIGDNKDHHHLVCNSCGKIQEIQLGTLGSLKKEIEKKGKFTIKNHSINFFGYCEDCINKNIK